MTTKTSCRLIMLKTHESLLVCDDHHELRRLAYDACLCDFDEKSGDRVYNTNPV